MLVTFSDPEFRLYFYNVMLLEIIYRNKIHYKMCGLCLIKDIVYGSMVELNEYPTWHKLTELFEQKPEECYTDMYWWNPSDFDSRIEAIKKAIELVKEKYNL